MKTLKMVPVNKGTLVTFRRRWGSLQQREQKGIGVLVDWRCSVPWWRHGRYVNNPKLLLSFKPYELTCNNVGICSASTLQGRNKRHGSWWTLTVVFHQFLCGMMQARSSMEWYSQHIPWGGSSISLSLVACNFVIYIDWSFLYYSPNLRNFFLSPLDSQGAGCQKHQSYTQAPCNFCYCLGCHQNCMDEAFERVRRWVVQD